MHPTLLRSMKLSQIRTLSWGTAAAISAGSTLGIWFAVDQARQAPISMAKPWTPKEPAIPDFNRDSLLSKQRILSALSFIIKVEQPVVAGLAAPTTVAAVPIDNKKLDLGFELTLISYDENPKRRLVFLSKDREEDPYTLGDSVGIYPKAKINVIAHDYVEFLADDGRKQVLYLMSDAVPKGAGGAGGIARTNPVEGEMTIAPVIAETTPTLDVAPPADARPARRYVPTSRDVVKDDQYGIDVVKYGKSPNGEERYGISEKDLASLQTQALRLMSEIAPSTAYDASGKPIGIKLDFVASNPLAANYGVKTGDILTKVDGKRVTSTEEAQKLYDGITPNTRFVTTTLLRDGVEMGIILEMDDFPGLPPSNK